MHWTIIGQDKVSGKLETFALLKDGANSKNKALSEATKNTEVIAIIQGNHASAITLYKPFDSKESSFTKTEAERIEMERFRRCSEYWEGL